MLMGTYSHSLDTKGRLIIPARFRYELGENFILTKSPDNCLALYPENEWQRFKEKLDALPKVSNAAVRRLRRFFFGNVSICDIDSQGRILVPAELRKFADLKKEVVFVGVDDHAEIWDKEAWEAYNEELDAEDIMNDLNGVEL